MADVNLLGVCDGHGSDGHSVSGYIKAKVPQMLKLFLEKSQCANADQSLKKAVTKCDSDLAKTTIDVERSGSTCCMCLTLGELMFISNTGDSRALLVSAKSIEQKAAYFKYEEEKKSP